MIRICPLKVTGFEEAVRAMRNPMNSWALSNSEHDDIGNYILGDKDLELMKKLAAAGPSHSKYRRMIIVYMDISAPLYWWKEFDTYKVGTVAGSTSTMHKIHVKPFELDDFSHEHLGKTEIGVLGDIIKALEFNRMYYLESKNKDCWYNMIQLLPSSYNQLRTVMLNYEVLANIYETRKDHKLDEWRKFCEEIEKLPYSEIITGEKNEKRSSKITRV